ncbi:MAG: type II toxin-antitoxin system mRNA interferase toxin, RelE/StbE family [Chloroflexi bacterium]|nr:MAG: type II toxin-antitoxin system mRNA interferase toxin, RelE/StbE family [Chloroflexota bacterium]
MSKVQALKEWKKLDSSLQEQFKKKLAERLQKPHVISAKLSGFENYYKIKLRARGYRLIYEVVDKELIVFVVAVGKREKNLVYKKVQDR